MSDEAWLSSPAMKQIIDQLVSATVKQYRIDARRAEEILSRSLGGNKRLQELAAKEDTAERLMRTSVFKKASAAAKRDVYAALRRYRSDESELKESVERLATADPSELPSLINQICQSHASTRERQPHAAEFYRQLSEHLQSAGTVLDVGCGMQPLQFPFSPASLRTYAAFDTDAVSVEAVGAFAKRQSAIQIIAFRHDLSDGWGDCQRLAGIERFEAALMLKLVPVLHRQARGLLKTLAECPAKKWLISGSTQSLTKRRDISRREAAVIQSFIAAAGRNVSAEFTVGEELVFVAE